MAPPDSHPQPVPLVALLGSAETAFEAEFDRRLHEGNFCALSLAHSRNVLRHLADGPMRASAIVGRCGVTKQAISQQLVYLQRNGYVEITPDPTDQRARIVALTDKGRTAQCFVVRMFGEIEREWSEQVGSEALATTRAVLTKLAGGKVGCG